MTKTITLAEIDAAEQALRQFEATLEAELQALERQPPTPPTFNHAFRTRETLDQLRDGVPLAEGMDLRLYALLSSEQMRRFHFHSPGLAPLQRLRERLLAEQHAATHPPAAPPVLAYRYTGPRWHKVAGARRQTGDVIQLTQEAAARWADKLEPVTVTTQD